MRASDQTKYCLEQIANHSLYVWSGQGELMDRMNFATLRDMEKSDELMSTILITYAQHLQAGDDMSKARAYDCSGLIVKFLMDSDILRSDVTANGLYKLCRPVELTEVAEGDYVFKNKTNDGIWGHVGAVVRENGELRVAEAKGRAYGVITSSLASWKAVARPNWWQPEPYTFTRTIKEGATGDDVKVVQARLNYLGYPCGSVDGKYGSKTKAAVSSYQKSVGLSGNGAFGKNTAAKMGYDFAEK